MGVKRKWTNPTPGLWLLRFIGAGEDVVVARKVRTLRDAKAWADKYGR